MEELDARLMALEEEAFEDVLQLLTRYICDWEPVPAYVSEGVAQYAKQLGCEVDDLVEWWYWDGPDC